MYTEAESRAFAKHFQPQKRGRGRPKKRKNRAKPGGKRNDESAAKKQRKTKVPPGENKAQKHLASTSTIDVIVLTECDERVRESKPAKSKKASRINWTSIEYKKYADRVVASWMTKKDFCEGPKESQHKFCRR